MSGHPPLVMGIQQGGAGTEKTPDPALTEEAETGGNNQQILFENHGIDARYTGPVSYTHLDVYKRQVPMTGERILHQFGIRTEVIRHILGCWIAGHRLECSPCI